MRTILIIAVFSLSAVANADVASVAKDITKASREKNAAKKDKLFSKAHQQLNKLQKMKPKDAAIEFQRGRISFYTQNDIKALEHFDRAIQWDGNQAEHHFMRGVLLQYMRKSTESIKSLTKAVSLDGKTVKYRDELCIAYDRAKKSAEAKSCYLKAVKMGTKNATVFINLSALAGEAGNHEETLKWSKRAFAADPKKINAYINAGISAWRLGRLAEAEGIYLKGAKQAPKDLFILSKLVQLYEQQGKRNKLERTRKKLLKLRKKGVTEGLSNEKFYTRDQFAVGKRYVYVFEYFELKGDRAVRYSFQIRDGEGGKSLFTVSLGSYESTNQVARETGDLSKGQRLFHLDLYKGSAHQTLGMFKGEPEYSAIKKLAVEAIKKN
jgi:tetratricopeptide (TPR) repeat protein